MNEGLKSNQSVSQNQASQDSESTSFFKMTSPSLLDIPHSTSIVTVSIIDATLRMSFPIRPFFTPIVAGVEQLEANAYSFLIEHPNGQKLLFDLGARTDFESNAPAVVQRLKSFGLTPVIEKDVATILEEGGMNLLDISAVIWSHHHWDHVGDVSKFPSTTELVVGPGVPKLWPGYPVNQDSFVLESDYK
jgi:glyoxylase-like metal-dependent hydrolase (beta-lactamase superfamily II)